MRTQQYITAILRHAVQQKLLQMSHKESNSVRAAYTHKVKRLDQRRLMLQ
jgi:hypothetical protein